MVHDQAARTFVPGMRALDHPALSLHNESFAISLHCKHIWLLIIDPATDIPISRMTHNLNLDVVALRYRLRALAGVARVHKERLDFRVLAHGVGYHRMSTIAILHAGRCHADGQQQPKCVYDQVAFATVDFLARVETVFSSLWRAACGLRIEHGSRRLHCKPFTFTPLFSQAIMHLFKLACSLHRRKVRYTFCQRGKCAGSIRQEHPVRTM